ncbi:MAG: DUF4340 domain-containing protein [Pseudomonadota bacterium]
MSRLNLILFVALLAQVGLAITLQRAAQNAANGNAPPPLFDFEPNAVSDIHITDTQGNETVLLRLGSRWTLPELEDLPADGVRINRLLAAITRGETGWPVADTVAARQRFQVAGYHYRRRIIMAGESELLGTVYLGTSPGFRQVHARNDAADSIYSLRLNTFEIPAQSEDWLDRRLLQVRAPVSITADGYRLTREGDSWRSASGAVPDSREVSALLEALRTLQVTALADQDMQRELADLDPELVLDISGLGGDIRLELFVYADRHYIYSDEYALFFSLGDLEFDRLSSLDARLLQGTMSGSL